jgi:hypothetical protein
MWALAAACVLATAFAAPAADEVTSLPGWGAPLSKTYSGYLQVGAGTNNPKALHYLLYTTQGTSDASTPLVAWFNGGPVRVLYL